MEKASKEMLREFVNSQNFTSTTDIMNSMKELFSDVLQQVMEAELEEKLGYEKSHRVSEDDEKSQLKNYRNGYSKKTVKTQLGEIDVKIPRDRNGEYEPQIMASKNIVSHWTCCCRNWDMVSDQLRIMFEDRESA